MTGKFNSLSSRFTIPAIEPENKSAINTVLKYAGITFVITNISFIYTAIKLMQDNLDLMSIFLYLTEAFFIRALLHIIIVVGLLLIIPVRYIYTGLCPLCGNKLTFLVNILQFNPAINTCKVCKSPIQLTKNTFIVVPRSKQGS